jgi:hypothetical protein
LGLHIGIRETDELLLRGTEFRGNRQSTETGPHGDKREDQQNLCLMAAEKDHGKRAPQTWR